MSETPLLSQLLNMLGPDIRSSLGELQGTLHLIAHDLAEQADRDVVSAPVGTGNKRARARQSVHLYAGHRYSLGCIEPWWAKDAARAN